CYFTIGLQLAVVPGFVHWQLGYNAVLAGLAISVQYVATLASRPLAGRMGDSVGAVLTGFDFSLVFPALGVEVVRHVPARNRGSALGIYTAFVDLSLGISGPLAAVIVHLLGYPPIFLFAAAMAGSSMAILITLYLKRAALHKAA